MRFVNRNRNRKLGRPFGLGEDTVGCLISPRSLPTDGTTDLTKEKVQQLETYFYAKCAELHRPPKTITESWACPLALLSSGNEKPAERMKKELNSRIGSRTSYFIASFPAGADRKAYEDFAEAVKSIA